jgi:hypothetical protein
MIIILLLGLILNRTKSSISQFNNNNNIYHTLNKIHKTLNNSNLRTKIPRYILINLKLRKLKSEVIKRKILMITKNLETKLVKIIILVKEKTKSSKIIRNLISMIIKKKTIRSQRKKFLVVNCSQSFSSNLLTDILNSFCKIHTLIK